MHATTKCPDDFLSLERTVTRNASTVIKDPYAILVLRFISDRTFGWSKDAEYISAGQFLNGIVTKAGDLVCAGLPMAKSKLYACLTYLKEAGEVVVRTVKGRTLYSIPREFVSTMKNPKRLQVSGAAAPEAYERGEDHEVIRVREPVRITENSPLRAVRNADTKESHSPFRTIEEENTGVADATLCAEPDFSVAREQTKLEADLSAGDAQATADRAKRAERAARHSGTALFEAFAMAARATWPDMKAMDRPTVIQLARLKRLSKKWDHPEVTLLDFLEWSAVNRRDVHASKLEWVPTLEFTDYPDTEMMLRYRKAFRDSYDRRGTQKIRAGLTRRDKLIRQRMFKGFSQADAAADADELLAKEKTREDLNADRLSHNDAARRLRSREQSLETRLALAKARLVQPVAPGRHYVRPTAAVSYDIDEIPPLPKCEWDWRHEEECSSAA